MLSKPVSIGLLASPPMSTRLRPCICETRESYASALQCSADTRGRGRGDRELHDVHTCCVKAAADHCAFRMEHTIIPIWWCGLESLAALWILQMDTKDPARPLRSKYSMFFLSVPHPEESRANGEN